MNDASPSELQKAINPIIARFQESTELGLGPRGAAHCLHLLKRMSGRSGAARFNVPKGLSATKREFCRAALKTIDAYSRHSGIRERDVAAAIDALIETLEKRQPPAASYQFLGPYREAPKKAPEKWVGPRHTLETITEFLSRVYGSYLAHGMTRADLERLDATAYSSLRGWEKLHGKWVDLPTTRERNDAMLAYDEKHAGALPSEQTDRLRHLRAVRKSAGVLTL